MMMELVSIIIPCYNYGHLLPFTLDSVLKQSYENWEAIIIDDGSTDNTASVAYTYSGADNRVKYIYCANSGLSSARNKGIENSSGEYLLFLDADDLIEREKIEGHINHYRCDTTIDISYSEARYFWMDHPSKYFYRSSLTNKKWMPEIYGQGYSILKELVKGNIMPVSSPCLRREVVEKVGVFEKSLQYMEDWDFWIRCAFKGCKFAFLEGEQFKTMIRVQKKSLSRNFAKMADYENKIRASILDQLAAETSLGIGSLERNDLVNANFLFFCRALIRTGRFKGVRDLFNSDNNIGSIEKMRISFFDILRFIKNRF